MIFFQIVVDSTLALFKMPFTIYGITLSMWQVFLWTAIVGLLFMFIRRLYNG